MNRSITHITNEILKPYKCYYFVGNICVLHFHISLTNPISTILGTFLLDMHSNLLCVLHIPYPPLLGRVEVKRTCTFILYCYFREFLFKKIFLVIWTVRVWRAATSLLSSIKLKLNWTCQESTIGLNSIIPGPTTKICLATPNETVIINKAKFEWNLFSSKLFCRVSLVHARYLKLS